MQSQQVPLRVLVVQKRPDWMRRKLGKVAMRDCFGLDYALIAAMAHLFRMVIEPALNDFKNVLMLKRQ